MPSSQWPASRQGPQTGRNWPETTRRRPRPIGCHALAIANDMRLERRGPSSGAGAPPKPKKFSVRRAGAHAHVVHNPSADPQLPGRWGLAGSGNPSDPQISNPQTVLTVQRLPARPISNLRGVAMDASAHPWGRKTQKRETSAVGGRIGRNTRRADRIVQGLRTRWARFGPPTPSVGAGRCRSRCPKRPKGCQSRSDTDRG